MLLMQLGYVGFSFLHARACSFSGEESGVCTLLIPRFLLGLVGVPGTSLCCKRSCKLQVQGYLRVQSFLGTYTGLGFGAGIRVVRKVQKPVLPCRQPQQPAGVPKPKNPQPLNPQPSTPQPSTPPPSTLNPSTLNPSTPQPSTLNPQPSTLHTQPSTLDPGPSTLHTQSSTLHPAPSTLHPPPSTLNPQPSTIHPPPSTLHPPPPTLRPQPSALSQALSLNPQPLPAPSRSSLSGCMCQVPLLLMADPTASQTYCFFSGAVMQEY